MAKFDADKVRNETISKHYAGGISLHLPLTTFSFRSFIPYDGMDFSDVSEQGKSVVIIELPNRKKVQTMISWGGDAPTIEIAPGHGRVFRKALTKSVVENIKAALYEVLPADHGSVADAFLENPPVLPDTQEKKSFFQGTYTLAQKYAVDDIHVVCSGGALSILAMETVLKSRVVDTETAPQIFFQDVLQQVKNHFVKTGIEQPDIASVLVTATAVGSICPPEAVRRITAFGIPNLSKETKGNQDFMAGLYQVATNPAMQYVFVNETDDEEMIELVGAGNTQKQLCLFGRILALDSASPKVSELANLYASQSDLGVAELFRTGRDPVRITDIAGLPFNQSFRAAREFVEKQGGDFSKLMTAAILSSHLPYYQKGTADNIAASTAGSALTALDEISENIRVSGVENIDALAKRARLTAALSINNIGCLTREEVRKAPGMELS